MAELVDILTTGLDTLAVDERQTFTVNTAAQDVELDAIVAGQGQLRTENPAIFQVDAKDSIIIQSIGIFFPYNFVLSSRVMRVFLAWKDALGGGVINIGTQSLFSIPFQNYELSIGGFIPWPTPRALPYSLQLIISAAPNAAASRARVSMIGVPAVLNAQVMPITAFIKISHNLPLV